MRYTLAVLKKPSNGDWYVYYSYRHPETGKLHPFKLRGDLNRIKVKKEKEYTGTIMVSEINVMLKEGWSPFISPEQSKFAKDTLKTILPKLYLIKSPTIRPRTAQHYKHATDIFNEFLTYDIRPENFTKSMAQSYSDYLIITKNYKGKSHNNQILNMSMFFNMMVDREIIAKNPFKGIKRKPQEEGKLMSYSKDQKAKIKNFTEKSDHPMYLFIQWIYYCFVRPNELMQLQVKNIDFESGLVNIPASVSKNRKHGIVPIPSMFLKIVKNKYKGLSPELFIFGLGLIPSPKAVHRNRASRSHQLLLEELEISNDHILYDWKNTGARDFILAGHNPYELMHRMRHHSLDQTMVYLRSLGVTTGMKTDPKAWKF